LKNKTFFVEPNLDKINQQEAFLTQKNTPNATISFGVF
jgi:hypothetical protein